MKPCANIDFTTGKRCPNGATALSIIDDFINDKMLHEVKPVIAYYNIAQASELELIDTTAAKIRDIINEKKDINKKLDNLIEMQLVMGVNQRLIDTGNKLNYRLQKIEEELQNIDVDTDRNEFKEKLLELHKDFLIKPYNWQSEDSEIRNITSFHL